MYLRVESKRVGSPQHCKHVCGQTGQNFSCTKNKHFFINILIWFVNSNYGNSSGENNRKNTEAITKTSMQLCIINLQRKIITKAYLSTA